LNAGGDFSTYASKKKALMTDDAASSLGYGTEDGFVVDGAKAS